MTYPLGLSFDWDLYISSLQCILPDDTLPQVQYCSTISSLPDDTLPQVQCCSTHPGKLTEQPENKKLWKIGLGNKTLAKTLIFPIPISSIRKLDLVANVFAVPF